MRLLSDGLLKFRNFGIFGDWVLIRWDGVSGFFWKICFCIWRFNFWGKFSVWVICLVLILSVFLEDIFFEVKFFFCEGIVGMWVLIVFGLVVIMVVFWVLKGDIVVIFFVSKVLIFILFWFGFFFISFLRNFCLRFFLFWCLELFWCFNRLRMIFLLIVEKRFELLEGMCWGFFG